MTSTTQPALVPPWPRTDVELSDRTLSVRFAEATTPDAPNALFLHGLGGSSLNWTDLMDHMRDRVNGYAIDLGGFGQSPPPRDGRMSPVGHAVGAMRFITEQGIGPVHLFGNSMGGAVALQLAANRPDLIRSLTLIAPALPSLRPSRGNAHLPVIAVPGVGERLVERYSEVDVAERVKGTFDVVYADASRMPPQRLQEAIDAAAAVDKYPYVSEAFLATLRGLLRTYFDPGPNRPWKLAERVTAPTLVLYGRKDPLVDPRAAHRVTKHFPNAHVVVLPDSGHVPQMEHPEFVVAAWDRFIAED
jgi:pimeloyl-ACP methyl ester carboxylesterase